MTATRRHILSRLVSIAAVVVLSASLFHCVTVRYSVYSTCTCITSACSERGRNYKLH